LRSERSSGFSSGGFLGRWRSPLVKFELWPVNQTSFTMSADVSQVMTVQQRRATSLSTSFTWTFVGNAVYSAGQWIMLVLLAKLTRPEVVGQYALGLAVVLPVIMFTNLQLRWVITTDVREQRRFGDYLTFRLLATALALVVVLAVTSLLGYRGQLRVVILLVAWAQAIEAVSDVYYARLQSQDLMNRISKSMMARTVLSAISLGITVYFTRSLLWGLAAVVLARMIVLLSYDICGRTHDIAEESKGFFESEALKPRWDAKVQRELVVLSLPLGIIAVLVSLNSSIPRYFIERALGERALGIFSALVFMYAGGSMAVVSLGQSAFTRLARAYAAKDLGEFGLLLGKLLAMGATLGIGGILAAMVAGRELLAVLFRPEYADYADLVPWIMGAAFINYLAICIEFAITAAGYYKPQVVLFFLSDLAVGLGSYWLVHRRGLFGAISAILISAVVQLAGSLVILVTSMRRYARACAENVRAA
jgi:O-antigen/teichoic acid export membrane protein